MLALPNGVWTWPQNLSSDFDDGRQVPKWHTPDKQLVVTHQHTVVSIGAVKGLSEIKVQVAMFSLGAPDDLGARQLCLFQICLFLKPSGLVNQVADFHPGTK